MKGFRVREGNGYKLCLALAQRETVGDLNGHIGAAAEGYPRGDLRACKDCRAFPGEACSSLHRLVILDVLLERQRRRRETTGSSRILWKNLKGVAVETFRATVFKKLSALEDMSASNADRMWNTLAGAIKDAAKDSLAKQSRFKDLLSCREGNQEDMALAKESPHMHYDCYYSKINQGEVRAALQKMGRNKAVGRDQIPIEPWRCLEDEGVKWLTCLFNKIFSSAKMPEEWRLSEVILIYKNKGDAQACSNYRGIKLLSHTMKLWELSREGILESWRKALEENGLRVSREKTEYLRCEFGRYEVIHQEVDIRIGDRILQPNESFKYLGSVIHRSGRIDEDVAHRIRAGWVKWRATSGVLCDRRIPLKLKGKFYKVAIRPAMLYGSECWPITKAQANRVEVAELRMLRWTCGRTMVDMIPNGVFRAVLEVDSMMVRACQEETANCPGKESRSLVSRRSEEKG
nr:hypothetical protein [Tanacetum cinerariifolium]